MTRILGLVGSPRKLGNTHLLVTRILEGAEQALAHTESVFLADYPLLPCTGCMDCQKQKPCPQQDAMAEIYDSIVRSDVLIFGTPVYWSGPTGPMKTMLDRLIYFQGSGRAHLLKGKFAVLVVPMQGQDTDEAAPLLSIFEHCLTDLGIQLRNTFLVPGQTDKGQVINDLRLLDRCSQLGHTLAQIKVRQLSP